MSPSPPLPPTSGNNNASDDDVGALEDKENQTPLPLLDDAGKPPREADCLPATSKFFGGGGDRGGGGGGRGRGGGGKGPLVQQSGLRRRFRPPLAAARYSSASPAASGGSTTLGKGRGGGAGGGKLGRDDDNSNPDPWGAEYAYPRLDVSRETPGNDEGCSGKGSLGVSIAARGGGSRLKRRRTLGLGSLVPSGVIRGLEGTAGSGLEGPGRRSKSLGGDGRCRRMGIYLLLCKFRHLIQSTVYFGAFKASCSFGDLKGTPEAHQK